MTINSPYRFLFSIVAFFLAAFISTNQLHAQDSTVTIHGYAPAYVGKTITASSIEDYFSMKEQLVGRAEVNPADSTFDMEIPVKFTQKIIIHPGENVTFLYVQPGGNYTVFISGKDEYNAYRPAGNNKVELLFLNLDSTDINYRILEFNRWQDQFSGDYFVLKQTKPVEFAQSLDKFKAAVQNYYHLDDSTRTLSETDIYFNTYVRYSMAFLDNIQSISERSRYEKYDFYLKNTPVEYHNDVYMDYVNAFYDGVLQKISLETNNRIYLGVLKSSPTLVMRAMGGDHTLIRPRLRELVMIKMLGEEFYKGDFPQTNIMTILDSLQNHCLFHDNELIAKNLILRLTELVPGGKAPDFAIKNSLNQMKVLPNYRNNYLYIHFYNPESTQNFQELEPLKKLYETYGKTITFITVYPENKYSEEIRNERIKPIPWETFEVSKDNPIWKNYKAETFPGYILIDGGGYVIQAPALGPMPNGSYVTIENTFFQIKRAKDLQEQHRN